VSWAASDKNFGAELHLYHSLQKDGRQHVACSLKNDLVMPGGAA
jgi:hypothetical protein